MIKIQVLKEKKHIKPNIEMKESKRFKLNI